MKKLIWIVAAVFLVAACDGRANLKVEADDSYAADESRLAVPEMNKQTVVLPASQIPKPVERKLIKNGSLILETGDVADLKKSIDGICKEFDAYIASESQNNYGYRLQYEQQIRVPAANFDALVAKIEVLGSRVENKNVNTQDVTEEFIDTEARLQTKKDLEARYRDLLKQAKTVAEIVSIETQIATVRGEIESMEGRLNYLKSQVAFSTLQLTYFERIGTDFGFGSRFVESMGNGWENLLAFIIGLVNIWPFMLIIAVLLVLFIRWRKRRRLARVSTQ